MDIRSKRKLKIVCCACLMLFIVSCYVIYLLDFDGSSIAALWQLTHGNHLDYDGMGINLPPQWFAIHSTSSLELIHMAGRRSSDIFFLPIRGTTGLNWEQGKSRWLESTCGRFAADGYDLISPPDSLLGIASTCVQGILKSNQTQTRLECGIADGRMLVTFRGPNQDLSAFVWIMTHLQSRSLTRSDADLVHVFRTSLSR